MTKKSVQTNLRLPADLKSRLQAAATENNRSFGAEVTQRLEDSFRRSMDDEEVKDLARKSIAHIEHLEDESEVAKTGAAVAGHLLARTIDALMPITRKEGNLVALERAREAALKLVHAYENVETKNHGRLGDLIKSLDRSSEQNPSPPKDRKGAVKQKK